MYYEMLAEAPENQRAILLEGLNQLLAGRRIPDDWKGGTIRLLSKREPAHVMENMRPVTLLQTTYKLLSAVVAFRLQRLTEKCGILETTQHGFRTFRETHHAIGKVKYAIEEARRKQGCVYLAYLDWFGAFCSVPIQQLFLVLERMGLAQEDMDLLRGMYSEQWLQVETPILKTASDRLERCTPQADPLSPL